MTSAIAKQRRFELLHAAKVAWPGRVPLPYGNRYIAILADLYRDGEITYWTPPNGLEPTSYTLTKAPT